MSLIVAVVLLGLTKVSMVLSLAQGGGWYATEAVPAPDGVSCDDFCPGVCNEKAMHAIDTPEKIQAVAKSVKNENLECQSFQTVSPVTFPISLPIITEDGSVCKYLPSGTPSSCDKKTTGAKRLCCCGTDEECAVEPIPNPAPTPTPPPPTTGCSCSDGDICTDDTCLPDGSCIFTTVQCGVNESCDPYTGLCEDIETIVPCVAVIDEWDNRNYTAEWTEFRTLYPKRSFCLLVPQTVVQSL